MADYDGQAGGNGIAPPPLGGGGDSAAGYRDDRSPVDSRRERDDERRGGSSYERERERSPDYERRAPPPRRDDRDRSPPRRRPPPPPVGKGIEAQVSNVLGCFGLSIRTRDIDLEDEFSRYGQVEKAVIVYDQRSERSRGFGFVTMRSEEEAARCIEKLNGIELHGRNIRVAYSLTTKPHQSTPGEYMGFKTNPPSSSRGSYDDRDRFYRSSSRYDDRPPRRDPYDDRRGGSSSYDDRRGGGGYDDRRGGSGSYERRREYDDRRAPLPPPPAAAPLAGGAPYDDYDRPLPRRVPRDDSPPPRRRSPLPPPRDDYR